MQPLTSRLPAPPVNPGALGREFFAGEVPQSENYRQHFGRSLDLDKIDRAIQAANYGYMARMTDLARETITLDGHVSALLQKRLNRVAALDWEIEPATGFGVDEGRAKERAAEVREALAMIPNFRDRLIDLSWGNFDGRSASEIQWGRDGNRWAVRSLHWIHPRRLCFGADRDLRVIEADRQTAGFADVGFPLEAVPYKFVTFKPRMFGDYQEREGLAPRSLYWSFFQRLGVRERMILMEIFGKPWRILIPKGGLGRGANGDAFDTAFEALKQLGAYNTARMPPDVEVQIVQPTQGSGTVHTDAIKDARDVLTKMYLGGVATTEAVSTGLGSSIGDVQLSEEDLIIAADAWRISECLEDRLTDAMIAVNYGPQEVRHAPRFRIRTDPPKNRDAEATRLQTAINVGLRVAEEEARDRLGYREVQPGEPYLIRVQRQPGFGQVAPPPAGELVFPPGQAPPPGDLMATPEAVITVPPDGAPPAGPALPPGAPPGAPPAPPALPPAPAPEGAQDGAAAVDATATMGEPDWDLEDATALAARMTELGLERCQHGASNRCQICGIQRVRSVDVDDAGEPVWAVVWRPIRGPGAPAASAPPAPPVADARAKAAHLAAVDDDPAVGWRLAMDLEAHDAAAPERLTLGIGHPPTHAFATAPETVFGTPDTLVQRGVRDMAKAGGDFAAFLADRLTGKTKRSSIVAALDTAAGAWGAAKAFAEPVQRELIHALMLGALDSEFEGTQSERIEVEGFAAVHAEAVRLREGEKDPAFAKRPMREAVKAFRKLDVVTRDVFDRMLEDAQRRAFTVAGAATDEVVSTVKRELVRQIARGADLRDFGKAAATRLDAAGWTPINASHVENVFRTNVLKAYNSGRYREITQDTVRALRPYVQIRTANDGPPRQRQTHQAAHDLIFRADDPELAALLPPWGYQCRCRFVSLSERQLRDRPVQPAARLSSIGLPDPGFTGGVRL